MYKSLLIVLFAVFCRFASFGQIEGSNILLGESYAELKFDCSGVHLVPLKPAVSYRLTSSISDTSGNLIFYILDNLVFDSKNTQIGKLDDTTRKLFLLIVPDPNSVKFYYIFYGNTSNGDYTSESNYYRIYNVSTNNLSSPTLFSRGENFVDDIKIPGIAKYWLVFGKPQKSIVTSYYLDRKGLFRDSSSYMSTGYGNEWTKFFSDASYMTNVDIFGGDSSDISIYKFDSNTGAFAKSSYFKVKNPPGITPTSGGCTRPFLGISPDNSKIYIPFGCGCGKCNGFEIMQVDLSSNDAKSITKSAIIVSKSDSNRHDWGDFIEGADCKIYIASYDQFASTINYPNKGGTACNYNPTQLTTNNSLYHFYANHFQTRQDYWPSFAIDTFAKNHAELIFSYNAPKPGETYKWDFGDIASGHLNHDTGKIARHVFIPGNLYYVKLQVFNNGNHTTFTRMVCVHKGLFTNVYDTALCVFDTLKRDAGNPGSNFLWSNGDTTQTTKITKPGKYWLKISSDSATINDTFSVTIKNIHVNLGKDTQVCNTQNLSLSTGIQNASYFWSTGDTGSFINLKQAGTYWVKVDSDECIASDTVNVYEKQITVNIGPDTIICTGVQKTLRSNIANASYTWSTGDSTESITINKKGNYWLKVDSAGCMGADTIHISEKRIEVNIGKDTAVCTGDSINLKSNIFNSTFLWSTGDSSSSITVNKPGIYWLRADSNGCYGFDTMQLSIYPSPVLIPHAVSYFCIYDTGTIQLTEQSFYNYKWQTGDTTESINVNKPGVYRILITSNRGCQASDSFILKSNCPGRIYIPNAFTPNGNAYNNTFNAVGLNLSSYYMTIYNRWGECIFTTNDISKGWDGNFKGSKAPEGIYLYLITYQFPDQPKGYVNGNVLLIR